MTITIALPQGARCLLKDGQEVDFGSPFLATGKKLEFSIPLAKRLGVQSAKIFRYMKKLVGDTVAKDEVIATKKTLLSEMHVKSDKDGVIKEINHYEGVVIVIGEGEETETVPAFFKGRVESVKKHEIVLKIGHAKEFPLKKPAESFGGEWLAVESGNKESEFKNKVVFAPALSNYLLAKSEALGAIGYVCLEKLPQTSLPTAQLKNIDDMKKITDAELPYCLVDSVSSTMYLYK